MERSCHPMEMLVLAKQCAARTRNSWGPGRLCVVVIFCLWSISLAHAGATLLLEEPYSYDGSFAGTGHVAVYLDNVCSESPVILRPCGEGEFGVVLSRYDGISGHDWIAIPLIPYLYAVDRAEAVPLFADAKLVAFLRDQYRRDHLEALAPDRPDGGTPDGNWYELVGSAYDRTIYGFEIETSPEQDALLINKFNSESNLQRYNFVRRNCADFVREVINFYYPHALHRSVIGDLGVTTPKQIAKMLVKYSHHHPRLRTSDFLIPQVPGAIRRSKPIHGVLESVMAAKKYMVPVVILHPYIGGGLLAEHFFHKGFDPARNALILDSNGQLNPPMTHDERLALQSRLDELSLAPSVGDPVNKGKANEGKNKEVKTWERLQASAQTRLDASGQPFLQMGVDDDSDQVGLSRANIVNGSGAPELGARLLEARIRQELRPASARKTSPSDVRTDLRLYQRLLSFQPRESAVAPASTTNSPVQAPSASQ
ncbi:MAG TPA: hypothetical protein VN946_18320 [Terriglobales bacterium]|jgi:hypothetical protein|nr:hypothetical protein [Terriglobales bacterium]